MSAHCSNCLSSNVLGVEAASVCTECASVTVAGSSIGAPAIGAATLALVVFAVVFRVSRKIKLPQPAAKLA
ncbi:MAG: hypothetical protein Phyf2KO_09650 [Phycisphaerales bacterium]